MNMSYCRFRNTLIDLEDCINALEEKEELSEEEKRAAIDMLHTFCDFLYKAGVIDTDLDEEFFERLDELIENI